MKVERYSVKLRSVACNAVSLGYLLKNPPKKRKKGLVL
jgi:hypothetical protein